MELWTAFIVGLAGSFHCVGMCGPIALALPSAGVSPLRFIVGRLIYNMGRLVTYSTLGAISGLFGHTIAAGGYQQALSISLGVIILLLILVPLRMISKMLPFDIYTRMMTVLKRNWSFLFRRQSLLSMLLIGILNGFLPCGLVYFAMAGAATSGSVIGGIAYMTIFGVGTIPIMLVTSLGSRILGSRVKHAVNRFLPVGGVLLALLLILRGLSLGIPYLSPEISQDHSGRQEINCCEATERDSAAAVSK